MIHSSSWRRRSVGGEGRLADDRAKAPDDARSDRDRKHREDLLDEALAESFPASDPPSMVRPPAKSG